MASLPFPRDVPSMMSNSQIMSQTIEHIPSSKNFRLSIIIVFLHSTHCWRVWWTGYYTYTLQSPPQAQATNIALYVHTYWYVCSTQHDRITIQSHDGSTGNCAGYQMFICNILSLSLKLLLIYVLCTTEWNDVVCFYFCFFTLFCFSFWFHLCICWVYRQMLLWVTHSHSHSTKKKKCIYDSKAAWCLSIISSKTLSGKENM